MDRLEENSETNNLTWDSMHEFFLIFTANFNTNFIIKSLISYQQHLSQSSSIFNKARVSKFYTYLKHSKFYQEMNTTNRE